MVKVVGRYHVRAMRAFVRRKLAQQQGLLAREKEAAQKVSRRDLPEYDPDDNGRFAGYDAIFKCEGPRYEALCRVLKKILRAAHYRTWAAANGELVNGPAPCLSAKEIAERVGRHRRTIEIDLQEMREKRLLHLQPTQREGRWVMEMHYDVLYRLVHEYLEWERSPDYIPPERQYFERMEISPDLRQHLLQFEDYRKVLARKKPGPKVKSGHQETYPAHTVCTGCTGQHFQHTYSDASILPAASQGGMTRSVNLELPAPPALPQAGVSRSILPIAPLKPIEAETPVSASYQQENLFVQDDYENAPTNEPLNEPLDEETDENGAYIYRAQLSPPLQEIRMDKNGTRSIFLVKAREVPHLEDEEGTLYFAGSTIPQLYSNLQLLQRRKEYFFAMAELGAEITCLFDPEAIGAAVSLGFSSPDVSEEDEIVMRMLYTEPERDEPQENKDAQTEMALAGSYDDAPDRATKQEAYVEREVEKLNVIAPSAVFSYGSREIVHGGVAGATYPAIVPLLRDFMQKKLLGGDTATRYFVAYERLDVPHIERAFPPGTNGVWLWRDRDQLVHVKPTCSSLDPALKNRNLSLLSVAVGKLADDDGRFYFAEPRTDGADRPSMPPGSQNVNDDRIPREAPAGALPASAYGERGDDGYSEKAPAGAFQTKIYRRHKDGYASKGPLGPAQQQAQERYNALLKQAKDGRGKGLQRLF